MRYAIRTVVLTSLVLTAGCAYNYQFTTGLPRSERRVEEWRHISMWGTNAAAPFDLEAACPEGVSAFGSYISVVNWLPAFITLGVYAPRTVYAVCALEAEKLP